MNYILVADGLWYAGHVLTGSSVIFSKTNHNLTISLVFIGQFITIISRPIGRITTKIENELVLI
jgi:hypothetical protein